MVRGFEIFTVNNRTVFHDLEYNYLVQKFKHILYIYIYIHIFIYIYSHKFSLHLLEYIMVARCGKFFLCILT